MRYAQIIAEEVFQTAAWVYHRTHTVETIETIQKDGFRAGEGDTYGRGIYATYDFESQFTAYMHRYGPYVIRAKVNLHGFLIFDMDVAAKVYGEDNKTLWRQIKLLRLKIKPHKEEPVYRISDEVYHRHWEFTSVPAQMVINEGLITGMRGLVYTGSNDGRCVVAFDQTLVVPQAYTKAPVPSNVVDDPEESPQAPDPKTLPWTKIAERHHVRSRTDAEKIVADPGSIRYLDKPSAEAQRLAYEKGVPVRSLGRLSSQMADFLITNGRFGEMSGRATTEQAKKAIFADPMNAYYLSNTHSVFRDVEVQRFLMSKQDTMTGLEVDDDGELRSNDFASKFIMVPRVPDDVLLKIIQSQYELGRFMGLFRRCAPHVRDPETMKAMLAAAPTLVAYMRNPPPDLLRTIIERQPTVVTSMKNPPMELVKLAVAEIPSVLLNLDRKLHTPDVLRTAASKHFGAFATLARRRNWELPDDLRQKVDDYIKRQNERNS